MKQSQTTRRHFLQQSAGATGAGLAAAGVLTPYIFTSRSQAEDAKKDRPTIGAIGCGSRAGGDVVPQAMKFGDVIAVCDVDSKRAAEGREKFGGGKADVYGDYRKILDRKDIDVVTIVVPDHWHSKIAIEAMKAGKDIYCEKPLTLTIDEGKQIRKVLKETGRIFQVGTQQRTSPNLFLKAVAIVKDGRIGDVKRVQCAIGGSTKSGPLEKMAPPPELNWDIWLGQTPVVDYIPRRCHYEFRWWYEYSGGKMTDWGAHHVDIATWGIGMDGPGMGPKTIEGTASHPVPFEAGYPKIDNEYNAATEFNVICTFPNGVEMVIRHDSDNGILFEGTTGKLFVNRGKLEGKAVDGLKDKPLPEDAIVKLYKGKQPGESTHGHMANFFACVKDRSEPISDVFTHLKALDTCHLANICIRLGRKLDWDGEKEIIVGDDEANAFLARPQRKGFEVEA